MEPPQVDEGVRATQDPQRAQPSAVHGTLAGARTGTAARAGPLPLASLTCKRHGAQDGPDLRQHLAETTARRKALDRRIHSLRAELRLCEVTGENLTQMEAFLAAAVADLRPQDASHSLPKPQEFQLDGATSSAAGTALHASRSDAATETEPSSPIGTPRQVLESDCDDPWHWDSSTCLWRWESPAFEMLDHGDLEHWEISLDGLGVARCGLCGLRLPLNQDLIDRHACQHCDQQLLSRIRDHASPPGGHRRDEVAPTAQTVPATFGGRGSGPFESSAHRARRRACCTVWPLNLGLGVIASIYHPARRQGS